MITQSGILVVPGGKGAPAMIDVANSLARVPRFGGHAIRPWSVGEHSLACVRMGESQGYGRLLLLHLLIHDAHESVLGDIPSTWCNDSIKGLKYELDGRIFHSIQLERPDAEQSVKIYNVDHAAVLAEAQILGPPGTPEWFNESPPEWALEAVMQVEEMVFPRTEARIAAIFYDTFNALMYGGSNGRP